MTTTMLHPPAQVAQPADDRADRRRRRVRRADFLIVLAWTSAAVAAGLFLGTGTMDLSSAAGTVTALGIFAGLVGSDLVLVMLILAARVPLIDRAVGHDRALAAHRQLGKPALYLLLGHALLLTVGYGLADDRSFVSETVALFTGADMVIAYLSLGLFLAVVGTSLVIVRRRLPYEAWHVVHLLSYAAVLFALPHQLSQGGVLAEGTVQRTYWISLYVVALGAIAYFRVLRPALLSARHQVRVAGVDWVAPDAFTLTLSGRSMDRLHAVGGQFFYWRFLTPRTWWHAHPLSLSAEPTGSAARITVRLAGAGTRRLATVPVGTRVAFSGPFGLFTGTERVHRRVVMVAAGIGITPIRAVLDTLRAAPGEATVVARGSTWHEIYHWPELRDWALTQGQRVFASIGTRAAGVEGWLSADDVARGVTTPSLLGDLHDTDVYICGPDGWADAAERRFRSLGVAPADIHRERFSS